MTLAGTRPEWVRLCIIIKKLDKYVNHILVDTEQNYDNNLRNIFFEELDIREPDYSLGASGSVGNQIAILMVKLEEIINKEKPDAFLVLGDTNSSLGAIIAKRMGVRVFHMEAGNRCFDDKVPEEVNRRIIDHSSDILLPYTERSRQNLLDEGIHSSKIYVTGNPIREVLTYFNNKTRDFSGKDYYLVTLHRQENVDNPERLKRFVDIFSSLDKNIIWPVHPRTRAQIDFYIRSNVKLVSPQGFFEFVGLEKSAHCVLTDSGTVQEECTILGVPVVTLRNTTERSETIESGSNFISGCDEDSIKLGIELATQERTRQIPSEYGVENVSDTIINIVTGFYK